MHEDSKLFNSVHTAQTPL